MANLRPGETAANRPDLTSTVFRLKLQALMEDLIKDGVIDPTKVVRTSLQNAASVASLMLTTDCMVAEKPKKDSGPAMPAGPEGMGGMGF